MDEAENWVDIAGVDGAARHVEDAEHRGDTDDGGGLDVFQMYMLSAVTQ